MSRLMIGFLIDNPADVPDSVDVQTKLTIYTNVDRATRKLTRATDVRTISLILMVVRFICAFCSFS